MTPEQRGGYMGGRSARARAAVRREVPGADGDPAIAAAELRRLRRLEVEITLPWTPLAVRWVDTDPRPLPPRDLIDRARVEREARARGRAGSVSDLAGRGAAGGR